MVTVEEVPLSKKDKMKKMKEAARDPLFIKDMDDVNSDFDLLSGELS